MKRVFLFSFLILTLAVIAFGLTEIMVKETELVSLEIEAYDPDGDPLEVSYALPFNEKGEWQTTYGDVGEYIVDIGVSDGESVTTERVLIKVKKTQIGPEFKSIQPPADNVHITEGDAAEFSIESIDLNNDPLTITWTFDGDVVSHDTVLVYTPGFYDAGDHELHVEVSDGEESIQNSWEIDVADFDRTHLLDDIPDVSINEGEEVSIPLPDFTRYHVDVTIGEPIGNDNSWIPDSTDAGDYPVDITLSDEGFSFTKTILVTVENVDNEMTFLPIKPTTIYEEDRITIPLSVNDPDNDDEVTFLASNLPSGSVLSGSTFQWTPSYDTLRKERPVDYFLEFFGLYKKTFLIKFIAKNEYEEKVQIAKIIVKEKNRPPVIQTNDEIEIDEGDSYSIDPVVFDLDNDKVTIGYSGWTTFPRGQTNFDSAGTHTIKVTATDGKEEVTKNVLITINNVNREPVIKQHEPVVAKENEWMTFNMTGWDPDGDTYWFGSDDFPENAYVDKNEFKWKPSYDFVQDGSKELIFPVYISDGEFTTSTNVVVEVHNNNRPPVITSVEPAGKLVFGVDEPVFFNVQATDPDNDTLFYDYQFDVFEEYVSSPIHQRIFSTPGKKKVKVKVSDGVDIVSQDIILQVLPQTSAISFSDQPIESLVDEDKLEEEIEEIISEEEEIIITEPIQLSEEEEVVMVESEPLEMVEGEPVVFDEPKVIEQSEIREESTIQQPIIEKQTFIIDNVLEVKEKKPAPTFYSFRIIEQDAPTIKQAAIPLETFIVNN